MRESSYPSFIDPRLRVCPFVWDLESRRIAGIVPLVLEYTDAKIEGFRYMNHYKFIYAVVHAYRTSRNHSLEYLCEIGLNAARSKHLQEIPEASAKIADAIIKQMPPGRVSISLVGSSL